MILYKYGKNATNQNHGRFLPLPYFFLLLLMLLWRCEVQLQWRDDSSCFCTYSSSSQLRILPYLFNVLPLFFSPAVQLVCPLMLFYRPCTTVISLFPQVEVGDIIKVNGSDFVPADAAILSSRYRSPTCCQAVGTAPFFPSLRLLSLFLALPLARHSLKKWWLDRAVSRRCPI